MLGGDTWNGMLAGQPGSTRRSRAAALAPIAARKATMIHFMLTCKWIIFSEAENFSKFVKCCT